MISAYFKEALHHLQLAFFKSATSERKSARVRRREEALIADVIQDLQQLDSFEKLAQADESLFGLPSDADVLPKGFDEARRRLIELAENVRRYQTAALPTKVLLLHVIRKNLEALRWAIALAPQPVNTISHLVTTRWLALVKEQEAELQRRLSFVPIKNPFVVGNALHKEEVRLFKGRRDLVYALEENIIAPQQRPALLLYGRRRAGKSSTLLNLPNLLSASYVPIYLDLQDAKWREGDAMFCYHLARAIYHELFQRALHDKLKQPREEDFAERPFTRLSDYLDNVEAVLRRYEKQVMLTFDEYERMEAGIREGRVTEEIFNQLRHFVQHRRQLILLFSGSHRFEELHVVNWADYLINAKTLELSFLDAEATRDLLEHPSDDFNMSYAPGVVERVIELTHGQPYLAQGLGSELVNHLNTQNRLTATLEDLDVAVERVLVAAQVYFDYLWREECSDAERAALLALTSAGALRVGEQSAAVMLSLSRKEIIEQVGDTYQFCVALFRLWILKNQNVPVSPAVNGSIRKPLVLLGEPVTG